MEQILLAAGIFVGVFSIDYLRFLLFPTTYRYVSYETYALYIVSFVASFIIFIDQITIFINDRLHVELTYLFILFFAALGSSLAMRRHGVNICTTILRSYKCISPLYVLIKTKEILLQQTLFVVLALAVSREIGTGFLGVVGFMLISLLIQIPIMLHVKHFWRYLYGGVMLFGSVIFFYTYVSLELFWPAVYVHAVIYTFIWLTLAEPSENWG